MNTFRNYIIIEMIVCAALMAGKLDLNTDYKLN